MKRIILMIFCALAIYMSPLSAQEPVSVMTYNITANRNTWVSGRGALVIAKIQSHNADIVGVQEARSIQKNDIIESLGATYELVEFDNSDPNLDMDPILVKRDRLTVLEYGSIDIPQACENDTIIRHINWVHVYDSTTDREFLFYNNHFCPSRGVATQPTTNEVHAITLSETIFQHRSAEEFGDIPFVAVGDFNARRNSSTMEFLIGQVPIVGETNEVDMVETWEEVFPRTPKPATVERGRASIDWILTGAPFQVLVLDAVVDNSTTGLSDHFPVTALIELN